MGDEKVEQKIIALQAQGREREERLAALEKFALELGVKVFDAKIEDLREAVRNLQEGLVVRARVAVKLQMEINVLRIMVEG